MVDVKFKIEYHVTLLSITLINIESNMSIKIPKPSLLHKIIPGIIEIALMSTQEPIISSIVDLVGSEDDGRWHGPWLSSK